MSLPPTVSVALGSRSLRRGLVVRIMSLGLVVLVACLGVMVVQAGRDAGHRAQDDADRTAALVADELSAQMAGWRRTLLTAGSNEVYRDWFEDPGRRAELRPRVEDALLALFEVEPEMVDEACFIAADGRELARQTGGEVAPVTDLSPDESDAPFFEPGVALAPGQVHQTQPYVSEDSGRWVIANVTPVVVSGRTVAIVHFEANLDALRTQVDRRLKTGVEVRLVDSGNRRVILDTADEAPITDQPFSALGPWRTDGSVRASHPLDLGAGAVNDWTVEVSRVPAAVFSRDLVLELLALVLVLGAGITVVGNRLGASISRPVDAVTEVAEAMASGDLSRRVDIDREDELGRMAVAVNRAVTDLGAARAELEEQHAQRQEHLRNTQEQQRRAQDDVRHRAQAIVDETATALVEELQVLLDHVHEVQNGAQTITDRVQGTGDATRGLVSEAGRADASVGSLNESLQRVAGVAELIAGVASQTNLLALNATIEAARAGTAGQGFRVVADEVKSLAGTTARSTGEIATTIATIEDHARTVARVISSMAGSVNGIEEITGDVITVTGRQTELVATMEAAVRRSMSRVQALTTATSAVERRRGRRVPLDGSTVLRVDGRRVTGHLTDVSHGALACTLPAGTAVQQGDSISLALTLAGRDVVATGTVRRARPAEDGLDIGIQFTEPGADVVAAVREYFLEKLGDPDPS